MFGLFKNSVDVADTTPATIPNTDTALKTYAVPNNTWQHILVMFEVTLTSAANSTAQNVLYKVKNGTTVKKTFTIPVLAAVDVRTLTFWTVLEKRDTGNIVVTQSAAAADANASTSLRAFFAAGMD